MTRAPEPRIRRHVSAGLLAVAVMAMLAPGAAGLAAPPTRAVPVRSVPVRAVPARLAVAATGSSRATLRVVGLGDSVPSGGACGCTPYVQLAARRIGALQGRPVSVVNWASADDTHRLLRTVSSPAVRRQLAPSELVIVQAGANNFSAARISACSDRIERCYGPQIRAMRRRLSTALSRIYHLQRNARAEVVAVGYWNVFRDGAVGRSLGPAYVRGSDRLTRRVNAAIEVAAHAAGARYIDGYRPFKGAGSRDCTALLAADGDHPNAAGHEVLARSLVAQLGRLARRL